MRGRTGTPGLVLTVGIGLLASCESLAPPPPAPPVIEFVGIPSETRIGATAVTYLLSDGGTLEVDLAGYRVLGRGGWSGHLVVLGSDADGLFVAGFMRQQGFPDHCFVENEPGIDRGPHIEIHGILWGKSDDFAPVHAIEPDSAYPGGTRFCFDDSAEIASTVVP